MSGEANAADPMATDPAAETGGPDVAADPIRATVLVRPKEGILDPQGQAVRDSLRKLGFGVAAVRVGRLIEVELDATRVEEASAQLDGMCRQLLTNPLIETYEIRLGRPERPTEGRAERATEGPAGAAGNRTDAPR